MKWLLRVLHRSPIKRARKALRLETLEFRETPASLAGNVFKDFDNSGALNGPDSVLSGVTVRLTGGSLTTPTTVTTDTSGNFSLTGLAAGTYTLTVTAPTGTVAGKSTAGTAAGTAGTTNIISGITLTSNQDATGYRFGEVPSNLSTGGIVFDDANGNGTKDTGENGIAGVTVRLTGTSALTGTAITAKTVTTDSTGAYVFTNLNPGTYSIAETPKTGFVRGTLQNGTPAAASTATGAFTGIDLTSTSSASANFNFADIKPVALSLTQSVSAGRVKPGDTVTITYVAKNTGSRSIDSVAASVNLDSLSFVSASGTGYDSATKTWTVGTLAGGASATLTITARAGSAGVYLPSSRLVSTATASTATGDTAFNVVNAGNGGISMQNFLSTTYRLTDVVISSGRTPTIPAAPGGGSATAPTTPTVVFFNAAGTTAISGTSTTEATVVIKGVTSASTAVTIVETGATATSDSTGAYTFTAVPLTVGSNTFTLRAGTGTNTSQAAGTLIRTAVNAPATPTVVFFNAAGTTAITGSTTTEATTVIKGVTSANTAITIVETGATATSDSTGAYTFSAVPLTVGSNTFTLRAGTGTNTSQAAGTLTRTAVVAPTTPTVLFFNAAGTTAISGTSTTEGTTVIKGVTSASTAVTIVETGATATSDSTGAYSFTAVPVVVGSNTYTVKAGTGTNTSQATGTLTGIASSDTPTAPTVDFYNAAGDTQITDGTTTEATTVIKGTTSPDTPVKLVETGATATSDSSGAYSFAAVPVAAGANTFTVRATGTDGTNSQTSGTLTRSVAPTTPTVVFFNAAGTTAITGSTTSESTTVIKGVTSPNTPLTLTESGATTTSNSTGDYSFTGVAVAIGSNTYTVVAGSGSLTSQTVGTLTGAASAPSTPTIVFFNAAGDLALGGNSTNEGTVVINGVTSADTAVKLLQTGDTTTSDSTGAYSFSAVPVIVGSNSFTVVAGTGSLTSQRTSSITGQATSSTPTAPTVQFYDPTGATQLTGTSTSEGTTVIKGVTTANTNLVLRETGASATSDSAGAYSFDAVPVIVGSNTFRVQATGTDGTTRQTTATLTGLATPATPTLPTIVFFNAAGDTQLTGNTTSETTTVIKGVTSPDTPMTLVETSATTTSDSAGAYTFDAVPVVLGSNTYTIQATGADGTTRQAVGTLTGA